MKVAAYQAPLLPVGSMEAIRLIRGQVRRCEAQGVEILCCPEAVLGGLADDALHPETFAFDVERGDLEPVLASLASDVVTTIVGFTEKTRSGQLYNTAAILHHGSILGIYRKMHPAIHKSIYQAGDQLPVFEVGGLTFGVLICNDSNFPELARSVAAQGARALFIPANNNLPPEKADVIDQTRRVDIASARENKLWVIRADVAGRVADRVAYGTAGIVDPSGNVLQAARRLKEDLLVAELNISSKS